jgi:hypothetical protein
MMSVLLFVFLVELAAHLVNTIGAATINNLVLSSHFKFACLGGFHND